MLETLEILFESAVHYCVLLIEVVGAGILMTSVVKAFIDYLKKKPDVGDDLLEHLATALSFLLCGEVMHTLAVKTWNELLMLGATMVLRGAIELVQHWEHKSKHH